VEVNLQTMQQTIYGEIAAPPSLVPAEMAEFAKRRLFPRFPLHNRQCGGASLASRRSLFSSRRHVSSFPPHISATNFAHRNQKSAPI
jgi:hypothetical protein